MTLNLTSTGQQLLTRALAGESIRFSHIALGSGADAGASASALLHQEMLLPITSSTRGQQTVSIKTVYNNADVQTGYRLTEIGIYAADPDGGTAELLYAYGYSPQAEADYVPAAADRTLETELTIAVYVGATERVTVTLYSGAYALASDLSDHIGNTNNPHGLTIAQIGAASAAELADHVRDNTNPHAVTAAQVGAPTVADLNNHIGDTSNPHGVTVAQIGAASGADLTAHINDQNNPHGTTPAGIGAATATDLTAHTGNTSNPHGVTAAQLGLGNVQNVATNDQTPTFAEAATLTTLSSGEKLSILFGKIAKGISALIDHVSDTTIHFLYVVAGRKSGSTLGDKATAEGNDTTASGNFAHAEGNDTTASGKSTHAEGYKTTADSPYTADAGAHAEGYQTRASGQGAHAEGNGTQANSLWGNGAHAEGDGTMAFASGHAEGKDTYASNAHAEGKNTLAYGLSSHAEGFGGDSSNRVPILTVSGPTTGTTYSVLSGYEVFGQMPLVGTRPERAVTVWYGSTAYTVTNWGNGSITLDRALPGEPVTDASLSIIGRAVGAGSHAEGGMTVALAEYSHAEGQQTVAKGAASHAEGKGTTATHRAQHVFGEYNVADPSTAGSENRGMYVEVVGNGTSDGARDNARTLDWHGNETLAGKLTLGMDPIGTMDAATKGYVDAAIAAAITALGN